jgi:probable HAF family extracellular repeat protein
MQISILARIAARRGILVAFLGGAMKIWTGMLGVFLFVQMAPIAEAQSYIVTDLGALKGDNESNGFWLNNYGEVVGCSDTMSAQGYPCTGTVAGQHAFIWSKSTGMKDLGTLSGGTISGATGINDLGAVVGYSNVKGKPVTDFLAFLWTGAGGMVNLGTLAGGNSSAAFEINSSGTIAGDSFVTSTQVNATSWINNQIRNLGRLPTAIFTAGLDVNGNNEIVGESVFSYGPPFKSHAFAWTSGKGMIDLGTLAGGITSLAYAINSSGIIVGQSDGSSTASNWHAVKWDSERKIHDLGTMPGGSYSVAFAINDSDVIVGYGNLSTNAAHALIWTSTGVKDLNSLIPANSGWVLINANAINNVGQITGYGTIHGYNHAFLLTPK